MSARDLDPGEGCEWVEVEGERLNLTHAEADDWLERKPEHGQGLPPAGGWKGHMLDEYSPAYQDEYRRLWLATDSRHRELIATMKTFAGELEREAKESQNALTCVVLRCTAQRLRNHVFATDAARR